MFEKWDTKDKIGESQSIDANGGAKLLIHVGLLVNIKVILNGRNSNELGQFQFHAT